MEMDWKCSDPKIYLDAGDSGKMPNWSIYW